jgi:hypothetical protein
MSDLETLVRLEIVAEVAEGRKEKRDLRLLIRLRQGYDGQVVDFGFLNGREGDGVVRNLRFKV